MLACINYDNWMAGFTQRLSGDCITSGTHKQPINYKIMHE